MAVEKFVTKTLELLEKERDCEIEETRVLHENLPPKELQRRGVCLLKLRISERKTGLYGRSIVTFQPQIAGQDLPSHNLSPGDIVGLSISNSDDRESITSGIIFRVWRGSLSVAFDESFDAFSLSDEEKYKLLKLANNVTYKRLKRALSDLNTYHSAGSASHLVNVLFQLSEISSPDIPSEINFNNDGLDESQKEAVRFALCQKDVAVIHGPPGTGKTTTVVEIIIQAVRRGLKVLACASSNIAVDNLVERLANEKQKILRIGHPARLLPHIQQYSLDAVLSNSDETRIVEDVRKDLDKTLQKMRTSRDKGEKHHLRDELKQLRKELRQREAAATRDVLKRADVVLVTLSSATDDGPLKYLSEQHFDITVIDECSQALEAACWMTLLRSPRCVLAGDHHQLPPTILSHEAAGEGLEKTLMERVLEMYGNQAMRMLTVQYRMNELIMNWSSNQLYDGQLTAHQSVKSHLLNELSNVVDSEDTGLPLLLIDTAGCDLYELDLPEEISKGNEGEADVVSVHVERLISKGVNPDSIAVIAPYNLQVELLRLRLNSKYPKLEIKSVDGFQGREKEAVIISMVRSNNKGEVGFLSDKRRINVAVTRARRHLAVICDTDTVTQDDFLKSLVDYLSEHGEVRSAEEYNTDSLTADRPEHIAELVSFRKVQKGTSAKGSNSKHGKQPGLQKPRTSYKQLLRNTHNYTQKEERPIEEDPRYEELLQFVETFRADKSRIEHNFAASFSAKERLIVHEIAQKLGLLHYSQGEGDERHISIKKPQSDLATKLPSTGTIAKALETEQNSIQGSYPVTFPVCSAVEPSQSVVETPERNKSKGCLKTCPHCGKEVIQANLSLHQLQCSRKQNKLPAKKSDVKTNAVARPKSKTSKSAIEKIDSDDFDALLAAATEQNSKCCFRKCKTLTGTLGQMCEFCNQIHCLNHSMPEVHGCGDQAKAKARHVIIRDGVILRGSGSRQTKLDPDKKALLQRKLDKKLDVMSEGRRLKKTSKK